MACLTALYNVYELLRKSGNYSNSRETIEAVRTGKLESFVVGRSKFDKQQKQDRYLHFKH
ncbi:hypothetical protein J4477_03125 [Candidatus Pacearchaeota archaeon]|nr:hypothetical protein [uncultured archaeon]MBS3072799.1 hypothetical protein [Candidatus Pacearchaeota archaeon]